MSVLVYRFYGTHMVPAYWAVDLDGDGEQEFIEWSRLGDTPCLVIWKYYGQDRLAVMETRAEMLYPISEMSARGTKWGFMNDKGATVIRPQYEMANDFQSNGLAEVQIHNKSGLINLNGQFVVNPTYQYINEFSEGRAAVIDDKGFGVIDQSGKLLTSKAYSYIGTYHNGRALFYDTTPQGNSQYGYLDLQGKEVIPAKYMEATDFVNGKAIVKVKDNDYTLIDTNGNTLVTYPYPVVGTLSEGLIPFSPQENGKWGYLNEQGQVVITPQFTGALPFKNGRAPVNTSEDYNYKYGLIDQSGSFIIKPQYNDMNMLGEDRVSVGKAIDTKQTFKGSVYALADATNGNLLTDFKFYQVEGFKNGLASVSDRQMTYFIDRKGHIAPNSPKVPGSGTLRLVHSLISANVDQRLSYYDRQGKRVWKPNTIIPLTPPYRVREEKYKPNKDYLVYYPQIDGMANANAQQEVNRKLKQLSLVKPIPANQQLDYSYNGDFSISFYKGNLVQFELSGYNFPFGAAHGMPTLIYAPVDLRTGEIYRLKDLFKPGSDYVKVLSEIIGEQIKNDPQYSYVFPDSYKGIKPNQPFFVTEEALHVYFQPYDIGPYAAGFPTFTIPYKEIDPILNKNGSFWKSFH